MTSQLSQFVLQHVNRGAANCGNAKLSDLVTRRRGSRDITATKAADVLQIGYLKQTKCFVLLLKCPSTGLTAD